MFFLSYSYFFLTYTANYFSPDYELFFASSTSTGNCFLFFLCSGTENYLSRCRYLFFTVLWINFQHVANSFLVLRYIACLAQVLTSPRRNSVRERNERGFNHFLTKFGRISQSKLTWWGFLNRGFNRRDYTAAKRPVDNFKSYCG